MSLFNLLGPRARDTLDSDSSGETLPMKMNLEERMAFRREVLFDVVRISMVSKGVPGQAYRLRVSRADDRGHLFVVMIDLSRASLQDAQGGEIVLADIGETIAINAKSTGLIDVIGVYWRVVENATAGKQPARPDDAGREHASKASASAVGNIALDLIANSRLNIDPRTYESDLAPLSLV